MPSIIFISVSSITIALLSYIVVFGMNKYSKTFNWSQMLVLVFGVMADMLGTAMMKSLATETTYDFHTISGYTALLLMMCMSGLGLYALIKKKQSLLDKFGKYYWPTLILWVIAYITGGLVGLQKLAE